MKQWSMIQNYMALNTTFNKHQRTRHFQIPKWESETAGRGLQERRRDKSRELQADLWSSTLSQTPLHNAIQLA